jgi:hypothetical protein
MRHMGPRYLCTALAVVALHWPVAAFAFDWVEYIEKGGTQYAPDVANIGLGTIQSVSEAAKASPNAGISTASSLATNLNRFSWATTAVTFVPQTISRMETFGLNWQSAAFQQFGIDASSFVVSKSLGAGLTACFASGSCAIVGAGGVTATLTVSAAAGIGLDSYLVSKDVDAALSLYNDHEKLLATLQTISDLQKKVDQQQALKQSALASASANANVAGPIGAKTSHASSPTEGRAQPTAVSVKTTAVLTGGLHVNTPTAVATHNPSAESAQTPAQLQRLKNQADALQPGPAPSRPTQLVFASSSAASTVRPGGISLSIAAAMRMRLSASLGAIEYKDGQIIFSGSSAPQEGVDAALLLTAMRAACEPGDPYFSLDPDDGPAWSRQASQVFDEFWSRVRSRFDIDGAPGWDKRLPSGFQVHSILAEREYSQLWHELSQRYPALKSRLVFRPEWLRNTRFGEILYRADVLLKELATGTPVLNGGGNTRAYQINKFVPADARDVAKLLIDQFAGEKFVPRTENNRLWFDLFPSPVPFAMEVAVSQSGHAQTNAEVNLQRALGTQGYFGAPPTNQLLNPRPVKDGDIIDISAVYPKMYVRRRDVATGADISGYDLGLNQLADDVNGRTEAYVTAYGELRQLMNIFRLYLAAVAITQSTQALNGVTIAQPNQAICNRIRTIPMLAAERVPEVLPLYRTSDLALTVATYVYHDGRSTMLSSAYVRTMNGGISLRGKQFSGLGIKVDSTAQTIQFRQDLQDLSNASSKVVNGRELVRLTLDDGSLLEELGPLDRPDMSSTDEVMTRQERIQERIVETTRQRQQAAYEEQLNAWKVVDDAWLAARSRWEEADARWRAEQQKATRVRLDHEFGPSVDAALAAQALPYALMLSPAKAAESAELTANGWSASLTWRDVLMKHGYSKEQIAVIERSGFQATIYFNVRTGEVAIAYDLSNDMVNYGHSAVANIGNRDIQFKIAADLALLVRRFVNSTSTVSLTGVGASGSLAAYAGEQAGISHVITFGAPILPLFTKSENSGWINISWADH